jgi:hypothetical protein
MKHSIKNLTTIDVWDTLLRRKYHPEAIKYQLARIISLKYYGFLSQNYLLTNDLYFQRLAIERKIAKQRQKSGFDDEYYLTEVLRDLMITATNLNEDDLTASVDFLIECEINLEKGNTHPDPDIREFVGDLSNRDIRYLSDFYMDNAQLDKILLHHKINQWAPSGYISSD